jgi:hypothetical protein
MYSNSHPLSMLRNMMTMMTMIMIHGIQVPNNELVVPVIKVVELFWLVFSFSIFY